MSVEPINELATQAATATVIDLTLEVVAIPAADVDRAKHLCGGLGWRLDADFANDDWRLVQMTPPGSTWYAAYIVARLRGRTLDDAAADAASNVLHIHDGFRP